MPEIITHPTPKRALRELVHDYSTQRIATKVLLFSLIFLAMAAWAYTENIAPLYGLMGGMVTFLIILVVHDYGLRIIGWFRFMGAWIFQGVEKETARNMFFPRLPAKGYQSKSTPWPPSLMLTGFLAPICVFLFSTCVFPTTGNQWIVVGQHTNFGKKFVLGVPFVQQVHYYDKAYVVKTTAGAVTADGVKVQGEVSMRFALDMNAKSLVALTHNLRDPEAAVRAQAESELRAQFWNVIAKRRLNELSSTLSVEYSTGTEMERGKLASLHFRPEGTLEISDLHPFFSK